MLPATAHARIVARLVAAQTPDGAYEALAAHLHASAAALFPPGVLNLTVARLGFAAAPVAAPAHSPANAAAAEARPRMHAQCQLLRVKRRRAHTHALRCAQLLTELYGKAPYETRMGGSIPAIGYFLQAR